eukprot:9263449-Pyramimonas_sp.AAC.1
MAQESPKKGLRGPQDGPNIAQERPKSAQRGCQQASPKRPLSGPDRHQRGTPTGPKRLPGPPTGPRDGPKSPQ